VSHDLRTPLRAIQGFSNILLEDYLGQLDSEGQRHPNTINSEVGRMSDLIDDILSLSRLSRQEMTSAPIDMAELVMTVAGEVEKTPPGRKLEVKLKKLAPARGERNLIRQVLVNLLSDAVKFTGTRETGRIEIGGKKKEEEITYYVKDNGVGFDMKYVDKLFGGFQWPHSSEEFEGTGVGLALVQRIIHRHGGRVWAKSKVNEGATFHFPLAKRELQ